MPSDSAALQAAHDAATGPTTIRLPANSHFTEPVSITKDFVTIDGLGRYESVITLAGCFPAFTVGVQPAASDGVGFDESSRPSGSGVYDSSVTGWGLDTGGRQIGVGVGTQFTLGKWGPTGHDYLGGLPLTWRFMFEYRGGPVTVGLPVFGSGDYAASNPSTPTPFLSADHPGMMGVIHRIKGDPTCRVFYLPLGGFTGVKWGSFTLSERGWTATLNGAAVAPYWDNPAQADTQGKGLEPQSEDAPFQLGNTGFAVGTYPVAAATDLVVYGLLLEATAGVDRATDAERYFRQAPETLAYVDFRVKQPGRWLTTFEGDKFPVGGGASQGRMTLTDARQDLTRQTTGTTLRNFSINGGGILLHRAFTTRISGVNAVGGRCGLATTKHVNSYPLDVSDCEFGGSDAAVSLYSTIGTMERVILRGGGNTVVRSVGTQTAWRGVMVTGFGGGGCRYVLMFLPTDDGCLDSFDHLLIDNEGAGAYSAAVVYAENGSRYPCRLSFDHLAVVPVPDLPIFGLKAEAGQGVARLACTMETFGVDAGTITAVSGPAGTWDFGGGRGSGQPVRGLSQIAAYQQSPRV